MPADAADVAAAWTLLAQGQAARAAQKAQQVLAAHPRSAGALAVAVAAAGAQEGAGASLLVYDRWIGTRTIEEPLVLRSIAVLLLREEARPTEDAGARSRALAALQQAGEDGDGEQRTPEIGNLIAKLNGANGSATAMQAVDALGVMGTPQALRALMAKSDDPRQEVRGAIAESLGEFPTDESRARLGQMLGDRVPWVRIRAAGSLLRLGDESGVPILLQASSTETIPSLRLEAASALASRPNPAWLALVRELSESPDLETRASAAVLLAPHDAARAAEIFDALEKNENPAIRDLAQRSASDAAIASANLTELRQAMHAGSPVIRVRAAARILDLTR